MRPLLEVVKRRHATGATDWVLLAEKVMQEESAQAMVQTRQFN